MTGVVAFFGFLSCIPLANWLVTTVGLVPVGFGLLAPAGVLLAGLALVLRDVVQREWGRWPAVLAIGLGAVCSVPFAPHRLAFASGCAFLVSEAIDFAVYTPLSRRGFVKAVLISSLAGMTADSVLFLWLAFGSLDYLAGQLVGKAGMVVLATLALHQIHATRGAR